MKLIFPILVVLIFSFSASAATHHRFELKVDGHTVLRNRDVAGAAAVKSGSSAWAVMLTLKKTSAKKFALVTKENIGKKMDIIWDGKTQNSPVIHSAVTSGPILLSCGCSKTEATAMAREITGKK